LIIDFSDPALAGQTIFVENDANSPFLFGTPGKPATTGHIRAFRGNQPLNTAIADTTLPASLNNIAKFNPQAADNTRQVVLFEGIDPLDRLQPSLGTGLDGPLGWSAPVTENPALNSVEIWEIVNTTEDAHPIHVHQVQFQVLDRQKYNTQKHVPGDPSSLQLLDGETLPAAEEAGWKDTVKAFPGEVTRIIAHYDIPGLYVWHCHILEHEDHEMMRPFWVGTPDLAFPPLQ
jgi:spore coat protein A